MSVTKLVLDYSKWRSGLEGYNKLGKGETRLKNEQGFMCCLGQWCEQIGGPEINLMNITTPTNLNVLVDPFNYRDGIGFSSSRLSIKAMQINDDVRTKPDGKIIELKELLNSYGIDLEVINQPKIKLQD